MPDSAEQVWVTSALTDGDVTKALILCCSIRQTYTTRKVAVIISRQISAELRRALNRSFDMTFDLDNELNTANLEMQDFVKLYAIMTLRWFKTCVYLSPNLLVLKNVDNIFKDKVEGMRLLEDTANTSVFLFKPSIHTFEELLRGLEKLEKYTNIGKYLHDWSTAKYGEKAFLEETYCKLLTESDYLLDYEKNISIVNMVNYPTEPDMSNFENSGILGKLVSTYWQKIYKNSVVPIFNSIQRAVATEKENPAKYSKEPIAIVGMSCRYPGSNNIDEFWQLLSQGQDGICNPPNYRWLREQTCKPCKDSKNTNAGFLNVPIDEFDAKFFGISPKEALMLDPQHRLLHELVWEGLEDADINPQTLRGTSGSVFIGSWLNEYKDILQDSGNGEFFRMYMGVSIGTAAARISSLLGLSGPSIATESGCSSAIVAVHLACRSLRSGESNLALACGVNLLVRPFEKEEMPMMVSPDGHSKTFSDDANGFARAEGAGVLVLKRLSDALKNKDCIWGLVRGSAMCQEGLSKSLGTPTVECEALAMKQALDDAHVLPEQVSYVEAHGTGTVVGDPMEVAAITKAYRSLNRKEPLIIGSVKTNVGHTESCSGITGIMKVILAMKNEAIPAHRNFSRLNPAIDLNSIPALIPLEQMKWTKTHERSRIAGVSSFGISGTDAHFILEESPTIDYSDALVVKDVLERPLLHILKFSAKSEVAMTTLLEKYRDALKSSGDSIANIAYSANTGRADFSIRAAVVGKDKAELCKNIDKQNYLMADSSLEKTGKICFLFTGQGSQYPGMARELYETSPVFRMHFEYCDKLLREIYKIRITNVLWSSSGTCGNEISQTIYSQTSIFCVEYALMKLWESWGVRPDYVLGHSLGEFAAAVCAGILSVENAIKLVAERSRLIDELPCGKMLVIKADQQQVERMMSQFAENDENKLLDYAAINSAEQTVVAGDSDVILSFSSFCTNLGKKSVVLGATHAFHSKHMDPMLEKYGQVANISVNRTNSNCGYISGVLGDLVTFEKIDHEYWVQHTREKVNFLQASKKAVELGCNVFIEVGPQPVLSALTMVNNSTTIQCLPSLQTNKNDWSTLLTSLAKLYVKGMYIDWNGFYQFQSVKKVRLPSYPFQRKKFWPEIIQSTGNSIHPLIGSPIPNASCTKLFQSGISIKSHEYIKDHCVGANVIFPGAGYLEMCLAAGYASEHGSLDTLFGKTRAKHSMKLENLCIAAPFALTESTTSQVQTTVECNFQEEGTENWNNSTIKIFQRKLDRDSWLQHASATFSPMLTSQDEHAMLNCNVTKLPEIIADSINHSNRNADSIYSKLSTLGLKFGPTFRSIEKVWRNDENSTFLAKVKVPAEDPHHSQYIIHPVILDAMIQAILMGKLANNLKNKLFIPVKIGRLVWISGGSERKDMYVQVTEEPNSNSEHPTSTTNCSAALLDGKGKCIAVMSGVEFVETTVRSMELALEQQTKAMPDLWEEMWKVQNLTKEEANTVNNEKVDNGNIKYWLVFNQDKDPISAYLIKNISHLLNERKVILVNKGNEFQNFENNSFGLRPEYEYDFIQLMSNSDLSNRSTSQVEGIIYCWSLDDTKKTQEEILMPFFFLTKAIRNLKQVSMPKLYVLTRGVVPVGDNSLLSNFHSNTIWGFTRSLQNEDINLHCKCIDIGEITREDDMHQICDELVWGNDKETQVAFHENCRYISKFIPHKSSGKGLDLPTGTDRFQLILPETKSIGDLKFGHLESFILAPGEIEIQVKSSALNFRDVFSVLKPSEKFRNINSVGFDFAGVVKRVYSEESKWRVGDNVYGVNVNGAALPSHVKLNENDVLPVPNDMTLNEACTLPAVVVTSYHCLIDVAKITSSDTVLIHTASGGVGLSAIEICKHVGANIIATAGSKRKKEYLKSLGIQHIFHSRNTEYSAKILEVTNGRGVDVVLNSLTSEGFKEATLKACANGARFVEMSKLSIWEPEEVKQIRPDVEYSIVDVSSMDSKEWRRLMGKLEELLKVKAINPITYICFNGANIREALFYLQKARHIGKVVCRMPEFINKNGKITVCTRLFNERSTYLITGGLGGIGFEVCKWMVEQGAKYVLLAGRNPPRPSVQEAITGLNINFEGKVKAVQLDVSNFEECKNLIEAEIPQMGYPALRGVMHAAGTLHDGLVENHTWQSLSSTFGPKVNGTLNLHELTKDNQKLEHFVLFSSIAALFGSPGQSNHSAGNSFEDAFAHYRNSIGLPATSVNWGVWGEVGIATEVDLPGIKPFSTLQGISALNYALTSQRTQIAAVNINSFSMLNKLFPHISSYVDGHTWKSSIHNQSLGQLKLKNNADFWQEYDSAENLPAKMQVLKNILSSILQSILKMEESEVIADTTSFQEMGVDSLMFVEIRNALQALFGDRVTLNASALRDADTVEHFAETLINIIDGNADTDNSDSDGPTQKQVNELIREDCYLQENIRIKPDQEATPINKISSVLLTGCTGTLGPHVLKELSARENIKKIVCLIRPSKNSSGVKRLTDVLVERDLLNGIDMKKVRCVDGNVAISKLGMSPELWDEVSSSVDAVFHCAASVQHVERYDNSYSEKSMHAVNVQGTRHVLEFACSGTKLKHVYCASSIVAVSGTDEQGNFVEDWPQPDDFNGVTTMAYPVTKFIGDMLMKKAILERGIPGKVFRFPLISGDSDTGRFVLSQNHLMLRYLFILKYGVIPSDPMPVPILPVDTCAWASVQIFLDPNVPDDIYNVCNAPPDSDQKFVEVAKKLGYSVAPVEFSKFSETVQKCTIEDSPFAIFKEFYSSGDLSLTFGMYPWLQQWMMRNSNSKDDDFMISKKISKYLPKFTTNSSSAMDHIYRDLLFAKSQGWLDKYCVRKTQ